ncbi:MAG: hypothetical protein KDA28_10310, partial [Phycisphaerales bacterium]|nr:hypothetical protein [Phycisphaerales bacterium]
GDGSEGHVLGQVQGLERPRRLVLRGPMGVADATTLTLRFDVTSSATGSEVTVELHAAGVLDESWRTRWHVHASDMIEALRRHLEG